MPDTKCGIGRAVCSSSVLDIHLVLIKCFVLPDYKYDKYNWYICSVLYSSVILSKKNNLYLQFKIKKKHVL